MKVVLFNNRATEQSSYLQVVHTVIKSQINLI